MPLLKIPSLFVSIRTQIVRARVAAEMVWVAREDGEKSTGREGDISKRLVRAVF